MIKFKSMVTSRYNDEEFMYKFMTGFKFVFISTAFTLCVLLFTYLFLRLDLIYFVAHGYPGAVEFQDAFYDFVYSSLVDEIPVVMGIMLFIFGLGFYLSSIMIRPFKEISRYCEDRMNNNKNFFYSPDYFSDLKLLTSFSVFFFSKIDEAKVRGRLEEVDIPEDFSKIHKPVLEKNFFINYLFIIIIFALLASVGIFVINNLLRDQIYILAQKFLNNHRGVTSNTRFLEEQFSVADIAVNFFIGLHMLMYTLFGVHLYGTVSGPAFAVFATMRSFLKGNYHNRVHLIGHYYLRNDCRKINKYLDGLQKDLT
jgi:hypothetical protein